MPLSPITSPLVIGTYNAGNGNQRAAEADFTKLTDLVLVLALQEVSNVSPQGRALVDYAAATGHQLHRGTGGGQDRTGLLLYPDLPILDAGFWKCTERTKVGDWGAGAAELGQKWLAWVTVEDPTTGNPVTIGSDHKVASVTRPAVSKAARAARERRRELYREHVARLLEFADEHDEALVLAGDNNAGPSYSGLKPLRAAGFTVVTRRTHGVRSIDHLWIRGAKATRVQALRGFSSDHKPLLAELIDLKAPPAPPVPPTTEEPTVANPPARFVSRSDWGASSRGASPSSHPIGSTEGVTLHWEGPHMGEFSHASCDDYVRGIQAFHKNERGWADVAYNAIVCPHGYVYEGRGPGVTSAANGNSTTNGAWYAVCYLGGQGDRFTDEGKAGMVEAVQWLRREGAGPKVNGHRDHKATECPGAEIYAWLRTTDFDEKAEEPPMTDVDAVLNGLRNDVKRLLDAAEMVENLTKRMSVRAKKIADEAPDHAPVMRELAGQAQIGERALRDLRQGLVKARADLVETAAKR